MTENMILDGVEEYAEGMDVVLSKSNGIIVIKALNEAGYNCTEVDLYQLLKWCEENKERIKRFEKGEK